ncbi:cation:proton antiporter [Candidatus Woesearchaeota archaeon]|nr:cation:proton antiporter [Candidatus Woesearchaeota archaeon]
MTDIFFELGIIIVMAGVVAYFARLLKQPLIPAYIVAGILLGPLFSVITDKAIIDSLSEIGITFLLFSAGLELDMKKIKDVGKGAVIGAITHMTILFLIGFGVFTLLGYGSTVSVYLGLMLIFSSTLVVIKLLSDKKELDTLHGRIIIGILLIQDLVAIVALSILNMSGGSSAFSTLALLFAEGLAVLLIGFLVAKVTFQNVFKFAAKNDQLLFVLTISILFAFSLIYAKIGFSVAIGAFVAGLLMAQLPYKYEMISQVKGLKEFFAVIFFVSIGLALEPVPFESIRLPLGILLFLILAGIPLVIMTALGLAGYRKRTAFFTGITLAQVSEFSLIMMKTGLSQGHIPQEIFSLAILLSLITLTITAYFVKYDEKIYALLGRRLDYIDSLSAGNKNDDYSYSPEEHKPKVILVGYDRTGYGILQRLKKLGKKVLVVDINPDIIKKLVEQKVPCLYGDIGDVEIIERLGFEDVDVVISTIPNFPETMLLIDEVRKKNPGANVIVTAYDGDDALKLYEAGADYVIVPHFLGGEHLGVILKELTGSVTKMLRIKVAHLKALEERKKRHPHQA